MRILSIALLFAAATAEASVEAVLIQRNGDVERRTIETRLSDSDRAHVDHAWIWNDQKAPIRVEAAAFDADDLNKLLVPPKGSTTLRFVRQNGKAVRALRFIAAPVEMWLEVPEDALPSWSVSDGRLVVKRAAAPWRARAVAPGLGSDWLDLASGPADVTLLPAKDVVVSAAEPDGKHVPAALRIVETPRGVRDARLIAQLAPSRDGAVHIASAPAVTCSVFVDAAGHVPAVLAPVVLSELPAAVTVERGATLTGRVLDPHGHCIPNASIGVEWWAAPGVARVIQRSARSDAAGRFAVRGVPKAQIALSITSAGFARYTRQLEVTDDAADAGAATLAVESAIKLRIADDIRQPVAGARLQLENHDFVSDRHGILMLSGIDAASPFRRIVRAPGYLPTLIDIHAPLPAETSVTMRRSLRLKGRFLSADGTAANGTALVIKGARRDSDAAIAGDGTIDVDVEPETAFDLSFSSINAPAFRVAVAPGRPGEIRDLGELRAPQGGAVVGRLVTEDLQPVSGASVWTLSASQPVMAWARGQTTRAESTTDGSFALRGAEKAPVLLRIDAPNYARAYLSVPPRTDAGDYDAGQTTMVRGATVHLLTDDAADDATVRIDLRGEGFEADMLTATMHGTEATVAHVPTGRVVITLERGSDVLCEQPLNISANDNDVDVHCSLGRVVVRGRVLVGSRPSSGMLRWERDVAPTDAVILTTASPGGITQQRAIGRSTPTVTMFVTDGHFESNALRPGKWRVAWLPDSGGAAAARDVDLSDAKEQQVDLDYGAASIRGQVVDRDGLPVGRAFVSIAGSNGGADSAADGSFILTGLAPGQYRIRARERNRVSESIAVRVEDDRQAGPVRLLVDRPAANETTITIRRRDGAPAAGAVAILETDAGLSLVLTSDVDGLVHASVPFDAQRTRIAALHEGAFVLTDWAGSGDRLVQFGETGGISIVSAREAAPSIISSNGWDIAALLGRFGSRLVAAQGHPLEVRGLPAGTYAVAADQLRRLVTVRSGDVATVKLQNP